MLERFLVQLFSSPQQSVARSTSIAPHENLKAYISSKERKKLDVVMSEIASHILFETASLKINKAIRDVQTISKLLSKDALEDALSSSPNIRNMGAAISNAIIPRTLGRSFFVIFAYVSLSLPLVIRKRIPIPMPAPKYKYDAIIVDGYNVIFAWEELAEQAKHDLDAARRQLCDILSSFAGFKKCYLVLVFDGWKVKGNPGEKEQFHNIQVVYTKENQTADAYIEALADQIGRNYAVRVATSDSLVQISSLRSGVLRMSARELWLEVEAARKEKAKHF